MGRTVRRRQPIQPPPVPQPGQQAVTPNEDDIKLLMDAGLTRSEISRLSQQQFDDNLKALRDSLEPAEPPPEVRVTNDLEMKFKLNQEIDSLLTPEYLLEVAVGTHKQQSHLEELTEKAHSIASSVIEQVMTQFYS